MNAEVYRCRKSYFSINVQDVYTSDLRFTNVVARWYGSAYDCRIFDNLKICEKLERAESPGILLGDSDYVCTPYLMTPFDHPRTPFHVNYNRSQIRARNLIERSFGVLKTTHQLSPSFKSEKTDCIKRNRIMLCDAQYSCSV